VASYRVKPGIRVVVAGKAYSDGATFTADPAAVRVEVALGYVTDVTGKAVKAEQVEDKATPKRRSRRT
jgi:hypothetical protein